MKRILKILLGFSVVMAIVTSLLLLFAELVWKFPTYEELSVVEGRLEGLKLSEEDYVERLGLKKEYYYLTIDTKEGIKEIKAQKPYIQQNIQYLLPQDLVTVKVKKDSRDILWVWEIEKKGRTVISYEEIRGQEEMSKKRILNILPLIIGLCLLITVISGLVLIFVFKVDVNALVPFRRTENIQDLTTMATSDNDETLTIVEENAQHSKQEEQKPHEKPVETQTPSAQKSAREETPAPTEAKAEKRYCVVFYGKIASDQQLEEVEKRVAALYKVPVAQCERLFTGQRKIIKNSIDYQTAEKYKKAFEKTGALCQIEEIKGTNV